MEWPMAQLLAANGYATATVEYRLSPEALYPAAIYDLKAAIRWMRANASSCNIDPDKIAVYGCSAGGELASFLGSTGGLKKYEGDEGNSGFSTKVQAVINVDGILNFINPADSAIDSNPGKPSAAHRWFGASYKENLEIWKEASPITYAGTDTPPTIFINSALPRYHAGRDEFIAILDKFNIYTEVQTIPDTPHPFWLFHPWFEPTSEFILAFLHKTFDD